MQMDLSARPLQGQVALVTGAARRIGRGVALRLAQEGARLVIHYRHSEAEAHEVAGEIGAAGGEAVCLRADLTQNSEIASLFDEAGRAFGRLDILVNNAGVFAPTPLADASEVQWDTIVDTNLKALFFCSQRAAPMLAASGHGRIVNLALARRNAGVAEVHRVLGVQGRSYHVDAVPGSRAGARDHGKRHRTRHDLFSGGCSRIG